jgi:hypothetical protein
MHHTIIIVIDVVRSQSGFKCSGIAEADSDGKGSIQAISTTESPIALVPRFSGFSSPSTWECIATGNFSRLLLRLKGSPHPRSILHTWNLLYLHYADTVVNIYFPFTRIKP